VFIQNATGAALNVTFVGEVPQGNLSNPVPAAFSIMASEVPQALPIGSTGQAGTLEFPAAEGDSIFIFNSATQLYKENYTYFDGIGWLSANPDDPGVQGPTIPVATGFFVQKGAAANWTRVFSVN
jgi:hypothetical protein